MKIRLYDHPFAVVAPREFEAESVAAWLLRHYGEVPKVNIQIYKGQPSQETDVSSDIKELLYGTEEVYTVLESPGAAAVATALASEAFMAFLTQVAIAIVVGVAMSVLFPPPDMPGNVNRTQASANNSLTSRENQVRFGQRVEDIYGTVLSIPSLMMPTYYKYVGHKQKEYAYYCIGRGYYDVNELKDGDTLVSDISKSGARIYAPFTSPNSGTPQQEIGEVITERIVTVSRPEQVNGLTLKAMNQTQLSTGAIYTFTQENDTTILQQAEGAVPSFGSILSVGDSITVGAQGPFTVMYANDNYAQIDALLISEGVSEVPGLLSNVQVVKSLSDSSPITNYTDWVVLDDKERTEVWANVVAKGGIYADGGKGKSRHGVTFDLEIEKLDPTTLVPTGLIEVTNSSLEGRTSDERAVTVEHTTSWVGPCRVRMKRTSHFPYEFKGTVIDETKWTDLYAVTPVDKLHFGNKTTIQTVSQATFRATSLKQRQLNCLASRKLPIYNGTTFSGAFDSTGLHTSGTIHATSKLVDILSAVCIDPVIGNDVSQLDTNQVYAVQQEMDAWDLESGQFNYTFDSDTMSFEETVSIIANAGFCLAYRQNGKIRLAFDKLQSSSSALFTHRNKKPNAETITRNFSTDANYDGIEFVYVDPDSNQSETIKLPLDESATKYKKHEIPGIRSFTQAWYRANREYQKLKGQRLSIDTTCTTDARLLLPNTRVDVVDNTRFKSYDGEVIKQSGLVLTLSRDVVFTEGNHSILLMKRDGSLDSISCTAGESPDQVILSRIPAETVVTNQGRDGIRTIFSFASDSSRLSQAWLVQEVGMSDGEYINIKAINYSDKYYFYDTQPVPSSDLILNGDQSVPESTNFLLTEDGSVILAESNEAMLRE